MLECVPGPPPPSRRTVCERERAPPARLGDGSGYASGGGKGERAEEEEVKSAALGKAAMDRRSAVFLGHR